MVEFELHNINDKILQNLSQSYSDNLVGYTPERISKWCYSQHFSHNYEAMYLIITAIICIYIYQTLLKFESINVPEWKTKSGKIIFNRQTVMNDLIWLVKYSLLLFCFLWLYTTQEWHWLDWLFNIYSKI
jgi:hypothetical protein